METGEKPRLRVSIRRGVLEPTVTIPVNFIFVAGHGLSQQEITDLFADRGSLDTLLGSAGISVANPVIGSVADTSLSIVDFSDYETLLDLTTAPVAPATQALNPNAINFYIVNSVFLGPGAAAFGASMGIPGASGASTGFGSGVVISAETHRKNGSLDTNEFWLTCAHEMGHWLGLNHTTEDGGLAHDSIADTPECPPTADADQNGSLSVEECAAFDGNYLMFWAGAGPILSGDQSIVLRSTPLGGVGDPTTINIASLSQPGFNLVDLGEIPLVNDINVFQVAARETDTIKIRFPEDTISFAIITDNDALGQAQDNIIFTSFRLPTGQELLDTTDFFNYLEGPAFPGLNAGFSTLLRPRIPAQLDQGRVMDGVYELRMALSLALANADETPHLRLAVRRGTPPSQLAQLPVNIIFVEGHGLNATELSDLFAQVNIFEEILATVGVQVPNLVQGNIADLTLSVLDSDDYAAITKLTSSNIIANPPLIPTPPTST